MKIRLHGTTTEVETAATLLREIAAGHPTFQIVSESTDYPDRGASTLVRRYLETRL